MQKQHVKCAESSCAMAIYHDNEYKEHDIDIEVQSAVVGGNYKDSETIRFYQAPKMLVASVTFHGSYEQMPKVVEAIARWIEDNHYRICGPMFNIYHVSPGQDPNPGNWITEACYQIEPIKD